MYLADINVVTIKWQISVPQIMYSKLSYLFIFKFIVFSHKVGSFMFFVVVFDLCFVSVLFETIFLSRSGTSVFISLHKFSSN